jgi:hypothetical protein
MTAADNCRSVATMPAGGSLDKIQGPVGPGGRKRGRPKGSRGTPYEALPTVTVRPGSLCPKCGISRRSKYYGRRVLPVSGVADGRPYRRIVLRRCRCLACGQVRIDRELCD